jgi:hypothetical protein
MLLSELRGAMRSHMLRRSSMEIQLIRPSRVLPFLIATLVALWIAAGYLRLRQHDERQVRRDVQGERAALTAKP